MPTRTELRRARTESRQAIITAATELVRETSYGALTVDDVMRAAGFSRTIFYRHFDDLADLLQRAAGAAFAELFEIERGLAAAAARGPLEIIPAAIEPAVDVYARHGPLLRAIAEAAIVDEQIAAAQQSVRGRFDALLADAIAAMPATAGLERTATEQLARALNRLNESYLLDSFGRTPAVTTELAVSVLTRIWTATIARPPDAADVTAATDAPTGTAGAGA